MCEATLDRISINIEKKNKGEFHKYYWSMFNKIILFFIYLCYFIIYSRSAFSMPRSFNKKTLSHTCLFWSFLIGRETRGGRKAQKQINKYSNKKWPEVQKQTNQWMIKWRKPLLMLIMVLFYFCLLLRSYACLPKHTHTHAYIHIHIEGVTPDLVGCITQLNWNFQSF